MHIWVDADACPAFIKDILFRAAERVPIPMTLVANKPLRTPASRFMRTLQVPRGFDVADHEIARRVHPGDVVITADIPLASDVIDRGAHALDSSAANFIRGTTFASDCRCATSWMGCAQVGCRRAGRRRSITRTGKDSQISSIAFSGEAHEADRSRSFLHRSRNV